MVFECSFCVGTFPYEVGKRGVVGPLRLVALGTSSCEIGKRGVVGPLRLVALGTSLNLSVSSQKLAATSP